MSSAQEVILSGDLHVEGRFVDASNATLFAKCTLDELEVSVIYKPIAGERPLWDFPDGHLAHRERAAYLLSEELALGLVPYTILREGPFGSGMVQQWIEIDEECDVVELAQSDHPKIRQMVLFDAIINNTDRKYGHILPTPSGEIYGCDHGVTFHEDPKLRTVLWQYAGDPFTVAELEILASAAEKFEALLRGLITENEIVALHTRISDLLASGIFPFPSQDWPSVPWPPF